MKIPRLLITAPKSGSGKTLITCGILELLKKHGVAPAAFKCGPDYIDPMFHSQVQGIESRNLDSFLMGTDGVRCSLVKHACGKTALLEGVMGYYDGISGKSTSASAYDIACITDTPAVLIVEANGAGLSVAALVSGFLSFRKDSHIAGVILNRVSKKTYSLIKAIIECECGIPVLGYVPVLTDCTLESRHLGLVMPSEIPSIKENLARLCEILSETIDTDALVSIAEGAPEIPEAWKKGPSSQELHISLKKKKRIALAEDEAFCFFYRDNLELLKEYGAELISFSPIHDTHLPDDLDGLLLYGGYPELHAEALSRNKCMRDAIKTAVSSGLRCMAECGGFLYLLDSLEDMNGKTWPMAGVLPGRGFRTPHLTRFGYVTLSGGRVFGKDIGPFKAHEFHYFDAEENGDSFLIERPGKGKSWRGEYASETLLAGFPHIHYYSNPMIVSGFLSDKESE